MTKGTSANPGTPAEGISADPGTPAEGTSPAAPEQQTPAPPVRPVPTAAAFGLALVAVVLISTVHLTQGTSTVGASDLVKLITDFDQHTWNVLIASRLPRLVAGILVGIALGFAGAAFQSLARNTLASPDTLGVNAGAHLAITAVAAFGLALPFVPAGLVAFVGGVLAAGFVLMLSAGGTSGPTRLILAGSATALALQALTMLLLLLFEEETKGLYAWGNGTLVQIGLASSAQMLPSLLIGAIGLMVLARRLDVLTMGEDTASVLGINVRNTRLLVVLLAVLLSAAAVTIAGPIGFVGLCAPAIVRLSARFVPGLLSHRLLLPMSALAGILIVVGSDVLLRAVRGGASGVEVPTGVITSMFGATVLVWLARQHRDSGPTRQPPGARTGAHRTRRQFTVVLVVGAVALGTALVAAVLLGDTQLLLGDVSNWLNGVAGSKVAFVLDARMPRVLSAMLAGAALAIAGTTVQAVCRNPLAEPGILGITAGAGVGAVTVITLLPAAGIWLISGVAGIGALTAFAIVYGLAWRGGLNSDRLVLIGVGVWAGAGALIAFIIINSDPWNTAKALTWLSGSTYGRNLSQVMPVLVALILLVPLIAVARRELDLLALDDDTPRVLGVRLEMTRMIALVAAALLTASAVSAIGVVGFVGLVAPHAARALVGGHHARVLPVAALLGALAVSLADTIGRTVISPAQIPAGLLTALIGTPYFVWLLWRSRA